MFYLMSFSILLVWFGLLSGHLLGKSYPLSWPCVLVVFCLFVISVISRFGFEGWVWILFAPVPVHCLLVTFFRLIFSLCLLEHSIKPCFICSL